RRFKRRHRRRQYRTNRRTAEPADGRRVGGAKRNLAGMGFRSRQPPGDRRAQGREKIYGGFWPGNQTITDGPGGGHIGRRTLDVRVSAGHLPVRLELFNDSSQRAVICNGVSGAKSACLRGGSGALSLS